MKEVDIRVPKELWPRRGGWKGKVVNILVEPGDKINKGDVVAEVEIEKAILEIESPYSGIVEKVLCRENETIEPGSPLITVKVLE